LFGLAAWAIAAAVTWFMVNFSFRRATGRDPSRAPGRAPTVSRAPVLAQAVDDA
jgi:hypothetical protein